MQRSIQFSQEHEIFRESVRKFFDAEVNPRYEIINLGGSQTTTLLDVVAQLENALGQKANLRFLPNQAGDMEITYADISRARRLIGYNPQKPFGEGIRLFADWFKSSLQSVVDSQQ